MGKGWGRNEIVSNISDKEQSGIEQHTLGFLSLPIIWQIIFLIIL